MYAEVAVAGTATWSSRKPRQNAELGGRAVLRVPAMALRVARRSRKSWRSCATGSAQAGAKSQEALFQLFIVELSARFLVHVEVTPELLPTRLIDVAE